MGNDEKDRKERQRKLSDQQQQPQDAPTAQDDRRALEEQKRRASEVEVEVDPPEAQENDADWSKGRDPQDVVEVEGQRETVESKLARGGPKQMDAKSVGATTKPNP